MNKWLLIVASCLISLSIHSAPLPAKDVFQVGVNRVDPNTFSIHWQIKPGYFLYSDRIKLTPEAGSNIHLAGMRPPTPLIKSDKQGHKYTVYRGKVTVPVSVQGESPGETLFVLRYQGCADDGFCYPPETKNIKLTVDNTLELTSATIETSLLAAQPGEQTKSVDDDIAQIVTQHSSIMGLLIFYGLGLLLSFTPCILPMVPVLSGIIVGHGKEATTKKAFFLSLSYVLSMSVTYALIGAVVAGLGANLQVSMQSPWVISVFSFIFVLLALSMFGFYEFKLPDSWQQKIAGTGKTWRGGHYWGAALMGCLSTLILSPCVTAPLIGVLTYIAQTGNIIWGSLTLFILSLGMGTPLLLIGTSAGKWLPSSGNWMNVVKAFFGVMLLAVALYLMGRVLPASVSMMSWACLLVFSGIYSGALTQPVSHQGKFAQGFGILVLVYGLLILIGTSMGATNPLLPLAPLGGSHPVQPRNELQIKTLAQLKVALANAQGKPVMIDFYADWCAACKIMDATVFKDPRVANILADFTVIKLDVTANSAQDKELMNHFKVIAPPTFVFFNAAGEQLTGLSTVGERSAAEFLQVLRRIA